MKILVIRFRQMGDAVMATPLLDSLRLTYPYAQIDFVLNQRIAPLFQHHPAISNIITFSDDERKGLFKYLKKVRRIVRDGRYDAIIDMRSTFNTSLFALFSPSTKYRIGLDKGYLRLIYNKRVPRCGSLPMVEHNLRFIKAINPDAKLSSRLTLGISSDEITQMREQMKVAGIDLEKPVALVGVTTKLLHKEWPREDMARALSEILSEHPSLQLVFNYAPGDEEKRAREVKDMLSSEGEAVFMTPQAKSMRELAALCANCTFYFGNEGGARHVAQAMGIPSLAICSPGIHARTWIPDYGLSWAVEGKEQLVNGKKECLMADYDEVVERLRSFCEKLSI